MRAAVRIRDRVGEKQKLVGEAVVVLHHAIDVHVVLDLHLILGLELHLAAPVEHDGLGVEELLVLAELADELPDAVLVKIRLLAHRFAALVGQD